MENYSKISAFQICRTCMKEIIDTSMFFYLDFTQPNSEATIRQQLTDCIPELDLQITPNVVICNNCVEAINLVYKFKNECLQSELQIHEYIQQVQHTSDAIDLVQVARFHKLCMDGTEFKMEVEEIEITEDFEIKDCKNDLSSLVCDVYDDNEEDQCTETIKQEDVCNYTTSTGEENLNREDQEYTSCSENARPSRKRKLNNKTSVLKKQRHCEPSTSYSNLNSSETSSSCPQDKDTSEITLHTNNVQDPSVVLQNEIILNHASVKEGKRIRDKIHSCYFCHQLRKQMAYHFEVRHKNELEVAKILAYPKNSKQRREGFGNLIRVGDYYHNCEVLSSKHGELILVRRPTTSESIGVTFNDYGPCPDCLGFMLKKHLWHHLKYGCVAKKGLNFINTKRKPISESRALLSHTIGGCFSDDYKKIILNKFKNDSISLVCVQDLLIMQFGALQYEKYHNTQQQLVRQNMRQLARLTLILRKQHPNTINLADWLIPEHFDSIIAAVRELCILNNSNESRPGIPSLALKLGHSLRKCLAIEKGNAIRKGNLQKNELINSFLALMDLEWTTKVSNALATLSKRKLNATELLPLTEDLMQLSKYLTEELNKAVECLRSDRSVENWTRLAYVTLSKAILFNKRRSGETSRMLVQQYVSRPNYHQSDTEEFKKSLTPLEIELASRLTIVGIIGKRGQKVTVILTADVKKALDLLIQTRHEVGISVDNSYLFARSQNSTDHIRGHDCLRKLVCEANLKSLELISSTKLRKYIATVCQIFDLNETECDWLARYLGHDIRIQGDLYGLHESTVELTKVSRLLLAVENGEANLFKGKKLEEINIRDFPDVDVEHEDEERPVEDNGEDSNNQHLPLTNTMEEASVDFSQKERESMRDTRKTACAKKAPFTKRPWTSDESAAVLSFFKSNVKKRTVPGKEQCENCKDAAEGLLSRRSWKDIKYYVYNHNKKMQQLKL